MSNDRLPARAFLTSALSLALACGTAVAVTGSGSGGLVSGGMGADFGQSSVIDGRVEGSYHPQNVLVRFRADQTPEQINAALALVKSLAIVHEYSAVPGLMCIRVEGGMVDWAVQNLSANPGVAYAERDYYRFALAQEVPYGVPLVMAPQAWATPAGAGRGDGAVVAVLDTGVSIGHPDLPAPVLMETFIPGEAVDDLNAHGTHCSGTVLGLDNDIGVIGVAPQASLMIGKVLGNGGSGSNSGVLAGIQWAFDNQADVISMSLGGGAPSQAGEDLCQAVTDGGTIIIAAAGNANSDVPSYPGSYPSVVCVAAVDAGSNRAGFSNFGATVDISGPGVGVLSSIPLVSSQVTWGGTTVGANPLAGSASGVVSGLVYSCDIGDGAEDFPAAVAGNIAHIRRGLVPFAVKVQNAIDAGAVGVIVSNNASGNFNGTLQSSFPIIATGVSGEDGDTLLGLNGTQVTITNGRIGYGYAFFSGTSMATPHVAGVAALLVGSRLPGHVSATVLRQAMEEAASDLGDAGRDDLFGHGLVDAAAALTWMDQNNVCPADWNTDGGVDGDDVVSYFQAWDQGEADFNRDTSTDGDDVIDFFSRWDSGC